MAKNTIAQRIALDGGAAIRKELEALGDVGAAAFKKLQEAAEAFKLDKNLSTQLQKVKKDLGDLGSAAADFGSAARTTVTRVGLLASSVAAAVGGLAAFSLAQANAIDDAANLAQSIGLTITEFGRLKFAASQNGVDVEKFRTGMQALANQINLTATATDRSTTVLGKLGISVRGSNGDLRSGADVIGDVADRFTGMADGAAKTALAMALFGARAGPLLIPLLNQGRAGIKSLGDEAERLGVVVTAAQAKQANAFSNAADSLKDAVGSVKRDLGLLFAPAFTDAAKQLTEIIAANRKAIIGFGEAVRDQAVPFIQDLIALLEGRDADVKSSFLLQVRDAVLVAANAITSLGQLVSFVFTTVEQTLQGFLDVFNAIFGTDLQARQIIMIALLGQLLGVFKLLGSSISVVRASFILLRDLFGIGVASFVAAFLGVNLAVNVVGDAISGLGKLISDKMGGAGKFILNVFSAALQSIGQFFADMGAKALAVIRAIIDAARKLPVVGALIPGAAAQSKAGGGGIRGPGSSTSDSIPIWASNGEWVIRAAAVRKYGHGLLHAINSMSLPRGALAGGFALGGAIGLAQGGPVATPQVGQAPGFSGRPLSLTIDGETFSGLMAPAKVAGQLVKFATSRNVRRLGTAPSWYR